MSDGASLRLQGLPSAQQIQNLGGWAVKPSRPKPINPNAADSSSNTLTRQRENIAGVEVGWCLEIENLKLKSANCKM